jgi:glycosyltransferase involved in cell wall biosynthesis
VTGSPNPADGNDTMTDEKPMISVAMATYNGERWLRAQLDSIYGQRGVRLEVVVCDDGSTDGTVAILEEYRERHGLILHRNPVRLGYKENFVAAMRACTAPLIALSDQDDVWEPEKLVTLADALGDDLLVHSDVVVVDTDGGLIAPSCRHRDFGERLGQVFLDRDYHRKSLLTRSTLAQGCTMLFRRELLDVALPIPPREKDHDLWLSFVAATLGRVHYLHYPGVRWRIHGTNTSQNHQWSPTRRFLQGGLVNATYRRLNYYRRTIPLLSRGVPFRLYPLRFGEELF